MAYVCMGHTREDISRSRDILPEGVTLITIAECGEYISFEEYYTYQKILRYTMRYL